MFRVERTILKEKTVELAFSDFSKHYQTLVAHLPVTSVVITVPSARPGLEKYYVQLLLCIVYLYFKSIVPFK